MPSLHTATGLLLLAATIAFFGAKYFQAPKLARFRWWGWTGLTTILLAEILLFLQTPFVMTFFTPVVWTGYVLLMDALVARLRGDSLLSGSPLEFFSLAFWSVPLWLIFEAYNLRLENWTYVGLPENTVVCGLGYVWSFATIWPAIFETAAFVAALGLFKQESDAHRQRAMLGALGRLVLIFCGLVLVLVPLVIPARIGAYLFGAVWIGFILLLDPLNARWNGYSFVRGFEAGDTRDFWNFLLAGWVCGILWEFWNYWAAAKWIYIFPIGQSLKVFEMPVAGYLGFLTFALECKVMYEFLRTLRSRFAENRRHPAWEVAKSER